MLSEAELCHCVAAQHLVVWEFTVLVVVVVMMLVGSITGCVAAVTCCVYRRRQVTLHSFLLSLYAR